MIKNTYKPFVTLIFFGFVLVALTGCQRLFVISQTINSAFNFILGDDVNVKEKSYAAADYMEQTLGSYVKSREVIQAIPLTFAAPPDGTENKVEGNLYYLSHVIPYQIGTRLSELGHKVDLKLVSDQPNAGYTQEALQTSKYILTGRLIPIERRFQVYDALMVSVNVTNRKTGFAVARFEYELESGPKVNDTPTNIQEINAQRERKILDMWKDKDADQQHSGSREAQPLNE
ncbi:MAG: hypothetical protein AAF182_02815 [Pseudomonadota bacterium]